MKISKKFQKNHSILQSKKGVFHRGKPKKTLGTHFAKNHCFRACAPISRLRGG